MTRIKLILLSLLAAIPTFAASVQGTVVNLSSVPVANQIVHVTDSSGGVQVFHLMDTTDASGNYSIAIPTTTSTGSLLHIYTEKCGIKYSNNQSYLGSTLTANLTVCGTTAGNQVSGTVTYVNASGNPANPAEVYLIHKTLVSGSYMLTLIDSTNTASNGEFHFYGVTYSSGDLLVKCALLPTNSNYWNYLPTYKESSITWSTAHSVSFTLGANDIHMVAGTNPGGPGFIGGSVLLGANKVSGVGDPLPSRIVLLTTITDTAVAYTFSNTSGQFSFPNLPYGTYKLFGDALGKNNPVSIITINAAQPVINDIVFQENSSNFSALGISNTNLLNQITIFPNPVKENLNIVGLETVRGSKDISVIDIKGAVIQHFSTTNASFSVPFDQLSAGNYFVKITTTAGVVSFLVTK